MGVTGYRAHVPPPGGHQAGRHRRVAIAQQVLGHRHVGTTMDTYTHVNREATVTAVEGHARAARTLKGVGSRLTAGSEAE